MNDEIERLKSVRHFVLYDSEVADSALYIYQIASFHPAFNVQSNICLPSDLKVRLITAPSQEWSNQPGIFGRHRASVNCLAISPSRTKLASASEDTFVRIWDVEIGHCILEMAGHTAPVLSVAFSPDGSQLVSAAEDGSIRVWDVQSRTGLTLVQFVGHSGAVNSVIYTVDGERVVSGSRDGTIRIWSIESGQEEVKLNCVDPVLCLSISPDGTTLVSGSANGFVQLWNIATHEHTPPIVFRLGDKRLPTVVFLDASQIAIGCCKGEVHFWSTHDGLAEMRLHLSHYANSIAFSPDGSLVASGGGDGLIQICDASSGTLLGELDKHTMGVRSVVFSADSRRLFSASADGTIRVWSLFDGSLPTLAPPDIHEPSSSRRKNLIFLPRARQSLSDGFVPISVPPSIHEPLSSSQEERRDFHPKSVLSVAFSPDERWLVSTSGHSGVLVWDTKSGKCTGQLGAFALHLTSLSFHPKSTSPTFACGLDKHVCLWAWDSETWKQTAKLQGHTGRVNCVQFSHVCFRHLRTGPSNFGIVSARPTFARSVFLNLPKYLTV
ncbi:WD40-repeat-containing domain protein [Mycena albidolilacea]|uniref:WD40-repeat-containing domain protein n=1 Tax=Mycena albidolilacea TaxID=1033008 RepID=A0AAD7EY32_9AGAR|nr:WD40-repeat-containing domain protein [Mycena albidolilacea]